LKLLNLKVRAKSAGKHIALVLKTSKTTPNLTIFKNLREIFKNCAGLNFRKKRVSLKTSVNFKINSI